MPDNLIVNDKEVEDVNNALNHHLVNVATGIQKCQYNSDYFKQFEDSMNRELHGKVFKLK